MRLFYVLKKKIAIWLLKDFIKSEEKFLAAADLKKLAFPSMDVDFDLFFEKQTLYLLESVSHESNNHSRSRRLNMPLPFPDIYMNDELKKNVHDMYNK